MLRYVLLGPIALTIAALAFSSRGSAVPSVGTAVALAPSLDVDACKEVKRGETFEVAISVRGVSDLMAWDVYYSYNQAILEVVDKDVRQLLDREPNSSVFDFSDPVPNTTGLYRVGAADTGGEGAEEDGSGVLAILTLRALDEGRSWSALVRGDADSDGVYEYGPTLTASGGTHISDSDGDGIFDGSVGRGEIAVGRSCREPAPTPYVDPDVVPVQAAVNTPEVSSAGETDTPADGAPGTDPTGADASPEPGGEDGAPTDDDDDAQRSPRGEAPTGLQPGSGGDSGGGFSPLLATLIGAGGGAGIIGSYVLFRAVRRPA